MSESSTIFEAADPLQSDMQNQDDAIRNMLNTLLIQSSQLQTDNYNDQAIRRKEQILANMLTQYENVLMELGSVGMNAISNISEMKLLLQDIRKKNDISTNPLRISVFRKQLAKFKKNLQYLKLGRDLNRLMEIDQYIANQSTKNNIAPLPSLPAYYVAPQRVDRRRTQRNPATTPMQSGSGANLETSTPPPQMQPITEPTVSQGVSTQPQQNSNGDMVAAENRLQEGFNELDQVLQGIYAGENPMCKGLLDQRDGLWFQVCKGLIDELKANPNLLSSNNNNRDTEIWSLINDIKNKIQPPANNSSSS